MKPRIFVHHSSYLVTKGIEATAENFGIVTLCAEVTPDTFDKDEFDYYIIDADLYACATSFFLPRRHRTLLITHQLPTANLTDSSPCLSINATSTEIYSALRSLTESYAETSDSRESLSLREIQVLRHLAGGKSFKEIAETLCISVNTVTTHRKNISAKLGIRSVSGLTVYAMMNGLL